jgi:hypothetical protein
MSQSIFPIDQFGPVDTPTDATNAFQKAVTAATAAGGGVVEISPQTTADFQVASSTPGCAVADLRLGTVYVVTSANDRRVSASDYSPDACFTLRGSFDHASRELFHSQYVEATHRRLVHGGMSQYTALVDVDGDGVAVIRGRGAHWYPASIEGFAAGMTFDVNSQPTPTYTVIGLGWDSVLRRPYFTADAPDDIPAEKSPGVASYVLNKTSIGAHAAVTESHCPNQASSQVVQHLDFSEGDMFGSQVTLAFQGNVVSAQGDEGGLGYGAEIGQDLAVFHGTVDKFDPAAGVLSYRTGTNTQRLGTARPLINLNDRTWITTGTVRVYITTTYPNTGLGITAGVVQGVGTSWGNEIVGRYFAIDEPAEYLDPGEQRAYAWGKPPIRLRRWWRITDLTTDPDTGAQLLFVRVIRWGTQTGAPYPLADNLNYFPYGGRELRYIIAPGAVVCDVRGGVAEDDNAVVGRTLVLQPNGDFGAGGLPFATGDPIEQALGPQPWNPTGFRVRHLTHFPSIIEEASFYGGSYGTAPVQYGLYLTGIDAASQYRGTGTAYGTGVRIDAVTGRGIDLVGDITFDTSVSFQGIGAPDAGVAIALHQGPGKHRKVIAWSTRQEQLLATLGFDPDSATYRLAGATALDVGGARLSNTTGVSATGTPAQNLRGISVSVSADATGLDITLPHPEVDAHYALALTPSWLTRTAVTTKTAAGFHIAFDQPPATRQTIDWLLIR